ncbi:MAG TPA: zinc ribbon domain-containing protein [Ktedonobacteraceae bacterium]|nr:zinc ribbon domain-containing protein [Ktedonobacteraceae bacterium]
MNSFHLICRLNLVLLLPILLLVCGVPSTQAQQRSLTQVAGQVTEYSLPPGHNPWGSIASGPDGNLWFLEYPGNRVGKMTTQGSYDDLRISVPTMNRETGEHLLKPLLEEISRLDASKQKVVVITANEINDRGRWMLAPNRMGKHLRVVYLDPTARPRTSVSWRLDAQAADAPAVKITTQTNLCPACKRPVQPQWKHCVFCGASLTKTCPKCGAPYPEIERARFCFECGSELE